MAKAHRKNYWYYHYTAIIAVAYALITYFGPLSNSTRFQISLAKTRAIQLSVIVPIITIWFLATYGITQFKRYADQIKGSPDGKALNGLAKGYIALVYFGLIAPSIFTAFSAYANHAGHRIGFSILNRYIGVGLGIIAFTAVYAGSKAVIDFAGQKQKQTWLVWFTVAGSFLYVYFLLHYPYRQSTPNPDYYSSFYLSDPLLMFSVAVPTIFSWVLGAMAVANIETYAAKVKGIIYRQALSRLVRGTQWIILVAVALQMLIGLGTIFSTASLGTLLLLIYAILALYAVGWLIIARGARRLRQIEEV